jgi:hypothetical protein
MKQRLWFFVVGLLLSAALIAQSIPTATISGKVTADGASLPGVTVPASSSHMQGTRTTVTTDAGDYILPFLPPGEYVVTYELSGVRINVSGNGCTLAERSELRESRF